MLQSVDAPEVSLPAIPMHAVRQDYRLQVPEGDRQAIEMDAGMSEGDLICLAVLILPGQNHPPACNLAEEEDRDHEIFRVWTLSSALLSCSLLDILLYHHPTSN